ncbi:MAG: putative geopeptide radical SAM maturase [Deltaproteobacteria bacterium]|nr:putative geopeptide radical SAM maturase [Deltaproteobacteria bacterium]
MHLSRYIKQYPCRDNPDKVLLFSTKRLSKVVVPRSVLKSVEEGTLSPESTATLTRLGFLVPDSDAERREMLTIMAESEERLKKAFLMAVMNLDCNLACTYCYEGKQRGRHYMSQETADLLVKYGEESFLRRGKDLTIDFYGGEPLLSIGMIRDISRRLKTSAEREGTDYGFTLVTNGTLLTADAVSQLVPLGLKSARVTLDGPRENHDRYRPYSSGKGSFDIIVRNLRDVCGLVKLGIGGNYTQENYREFPLLLDELTALGLPPDKIAHVMFYPVSNTLGEHLMPEFSEGCCSVDEPWLVEASLFLREEILKRGYYTPKVLPTTCMIEFRDNLVVHYDGTLYKCPAFIGLEGLDAGSLESGIHDYRESHNMDVWKKDECLDCAYLPLCFGGCRFMKLLQGGAIDDVECRKAWYDATLEDLILQDLRYPRR